jgi:hypothetical protein
MWLSADRLIVNDVRSVDCGVQATITGTKDGLRLFPIEGGVLVGRQDKVLTARGSRLRSLVHAPWSHFVLRLGSVAPHRSDNLRLTKLRPKRQKSGVGGLEFLPLRDCSLRMIVAKPV